MKRVIVLTAMLVCIMLASARTATAGECTTLVGGTQKDVFNNTVWNGTVGNYLVGYYSDAFTCLAQAQGVINNAVRSVCLNRRSAVGIIMGGDVYFDGVWVNGVWAPNSCRTGFGLNYYTTLASGQSLNPGDSLFSVNNSHELRYQTDANFVFYQGSTPLWAINCWPTCNTIGNAGVATMQTDGNLVVYDDTSNAVWNSGTAGNGGAFLALRNGELLLFATNGSVLWSAP